MSVLWRFLHLPSRRAKAVSLAEHEPELRALFLDDDEVIGPLLRGERRYERLDANYWVVEWVGKRGGYTTSLVSEREVPPDVRLAERLESVA